MPRFGVAHNFHQSSRGIPVLFACGTPSYAASAVNRSTKSIWSRDRTVIAGATALPIVLYLTYINAYGVNVPKRDDWFVIPAVDDALHGHLAFATLWSQYGDRRLFLDRIFFVGFGYFDHLNEKSIMLFSGVLFAVGFLLLLSLFPRYSGQRLSASQALILRWSGSVVLTCRIPSGPSSWPGIWLSSSSVP